jgi:hypothetical protein
VKADSAEIAVTKGYTSLAQIAGKMVGRVCRDDAIRSGLEHC